MVPALWQGTTDLTLGKVDLTFEPTRWGLKASWTGPYQACLSQKPQIGSTISGQAAVYIISTVEVAELDGGAGRIDVTAQILADPSNFSTEALGAAIYETEWAELQKAIETHPQCGFLSPFRSYYLNGAIQNDSATGGKRRTWEDWADLLGVKTGAAAMDYDGSGGDGSLNEDGSGSGDGYNEDGDPIWTLAQYQKLRSAGTDSYVLFVPVVRRTTYHLYAPEDLGTLSGKLSSPPTAANFTNVSNYAWLQGPDRCTRTKGVFCRSTEWQGFEKNGLSDLIYSTP
jgi:hypothetical protein